MFDIKDTLCVGGSPIKPCEDAIGYGENYCFVIDGASGLSGINIINEQSDAAWFARKVKEKLCQYLDNNDNTPTKAILTSIIKEINATYHRIALDKGLQPPTDSPSAGIVLFRKVEDEIEFFGLGDCTGVVELIDGTVSVLKDTRLCALDGAVLSRMAALHQQNGIPVLEAREACNDMLLANRNKRNKDNGYWILDLSGVGIEHALIKTWPTDTVKTIFACSDGFAQLSDTFNMYPDYTALFDAARQSTLAALCDRLFAAQEADSECNAYPRFKLRDDTSCLWATL